MNRKRLMHTAREVLPYIKPEKFCMGTWKCQTAACAFGHECMTVEARKAGLRLVHEGDGDYCPTLGEAEGMKAAAAYYDISEEDACWLFDPYSYRIPPWGVGECVTTEEIDPAMVVIRIETLLACEA
jgi:hypothetical protein